MESKDFKNGILASIENGDRLCENAEFLIDWEQFPTSYALSILAQEEYAKALLLSLVDAGAIPWSVEVRRALHDHICKQLVAVILNYISPEWNEYEKRQELIRSGQYPSIFPPDILDAIHLICHERIPREYGRWWFDPDEEPLDHNVRSIADGKLDRQKQRAIYVDIGKSGEVCSQPSSISIDDAKTELIRTKRIGDRLHPYNNIPGLPDDHDAEKMIAIFRLLTGSLPVDEFNQLWWVG